MSKMMNENYEINIENAELIKIKHAIKNGEKEYYITNIHDKKIYTIYNNDHMKWILSGDYADGYGDWPDRNGKNIICIEEDTFYDLNDVNVIDSITPYKNTLDTANNGTKKYLIEMDAINVNYEDGSDYNRLSYIGKIVFLFETNCLVGNVNGYYIRNYQFGRDTLYLFSDMYVYDDADVVAKSKLNDVHSDIDINDDVDGFEDYLIQLGRIEFDIDNPLNFDIVPLL